jgi:hypothetical protein
MSPIEQIEYQLRQLPPEKQREVLDFVSFLQQQVETEKHAKPLSLSQHPAFGSWRGRGINAVDYQRALRSEWDRS